MIKSVKGLKIGDFFKYEGFWFKVMKFPTRYSVCGINEEGKRSIQKLNNCIPGCANCKIPVSKIEVTR